MNVQENLDQSFRALEIATTAADETNVSLMTAAIRRATWHLLQATNILVWSSNEMKRTDEWHTLRDNMQRMRAKVCRVAQTCQLSDIVDSMYEDWNQWKLPTVAPECEGM